jgi:CDP-diacylglycerol--glycerol-3-phosphate 3-phosphatidyltransferase
MLTLPNLLTLSRILAVPILVFLLWKPAPYDYLITFVLYCVVGITDYFDGYLARAQGRISRLGQFLDPIADKIMVGAVLVMLMASRKADGDVPIIQAIHKSIRQVQDVARDGHNCGDPSKEIMRMFYALGREAV